MRATRWLLGIGTSFSVLGAVGAGCGGSTTSSPTHDSGAADVAMEAELEAAAEAAPEAAPDVAEASADAACVPDANINNISAPDASLGDAGATAAGCLACFKTNCGTGPNNIVDQCNMSCQCVSAFEGLGACLAGPNTSLTGCVGNFAGDAGIPISITSLACAIPCAQASVCGVSFMPPGDSGMDGETGATGDTGTGDSAGAD